MNLWMLLAITWISISVVIADSSWFVQDTPLLGEETDNLFSSEHLLRVESKPSRKQTTATPVKSLKKQPSHVPEIKTTQAKLSKTPIVDTVSDIVSDELLLVKNAERKPHQTPTPKQVDVSKKETTKHDTQKTKTETRERLVQDASMEIEGEDGLFPSEQLSRVYMKKPRPGPQKKRQIFKGAKEGIKQKDTESNNGNSDSHRVVGDKKPVSEHSVQTTGRKPLQIVEYTQHQDSPVQVSKHIQKSQLTFIQSSKNAAKWFTFESSQTQLTSSEDLSEEHLLNVQTKTKTKSKSKSKSMTSAKNTKNNPQQSTGSPCDREQDVDCLMEDEDLILVNKGRIRKTDKPKVDVKPIIKHEKITPVVKETTTEVEKPKVKDTQPDAMRRHLLDNGIHINTETQKVRIQPVLEEDDSDELIEFEEVDEEEEPHRRLRRQTVVEASGEGGFESEQNITESLHSLSFDTTLNKTVDELTPQLIEDIKIEFANKTKMKFENGSGFHDILVTNVTVDGNGRIVVQWKLLLNTSAAPGTTQDKRLHNTLSFINNTVIPFINNDLEVSDVLVYEGSKLDHSVTIALANNSLGNICLGENPCPDGFACLAEESICLHLCYHTNLICQHGGSCQLDNNFEPYCQCGRGYLGVDCSIVAEEPEYSTGQVVGAGIAGGVAVVGTAGTIIYLAAFRKKKEEDMEYSYFGDDDAEAPAYSDPGSNLGVGNDYYINRPIVNTSPLEIFNVDGAMA